MKPNFLRISNYIAYFLILLFCYAAISKVLDFENFQVQLAQSPLLSAYAGAISYGVIILELLICFSLAFSRTRKIGLASSFSLLVAFTVYIILILNFSDFIPCSCGGILEKLGWTEHLVFNLVCVLAAGFAAALLLNKKFDSLIKTAGFLLLLMLISALAMVGLFLKSEHIIKKENNFTRRFPHHPITEDQSFDLKVNSFYIAGVERGNVYLGNASSPFRLFRLDDKFQRIDTINIFPEKNITFKNLRYYVHFETLYAYDGSVPIIYVQSLDSLKEPLKVLSRNDVYFDQFAAVNKSHYYLRVEDFLSKRTSIASLTPFENHRVKINNSLLTTKADGGFDADGKLLYDSYLDEAFYIFHYRNQIIKFNQDLVLTKMMKTIDPVAEAKLDVVTLQDGRTKMNKPSQLVNRKMIIHRGLIFNEANLIGKHESKDLWRKNAVIDVYNISTAEYWGSFYVPHRGQNKMFQMTMTDDYFYILSGNEIVRYRCAQTLTKNFIQGRSRKPFSE